MQACANKAGAAKLFFDTQICANAAGGGISEADWGDVTGYIQRVAEYWISPLTVGEIILGIARGDEKHFDRNRSRLRRLYLNGKGKYFDFPRYFVSTRLGLKENRPANLEDDFGFSIQVILLAESKRELLDGVSLPHLTKKVRIRIDRLTSEIEAIQDGYVRMLSKIRGRRKVVLTAEQWAKRAFTFYGIENDQTAKDRYMAALDATYHFELAMLDLARNTNFDVHKNVSDLVDGQQLCYLCDPSVVFVTDDSDHKNRLRKSAQSARVLTFSEVLRRSRSEEPLLNLHSA